MRPINGFRLVSITDVNHTATPSNLRGFNLENGSLLLSVEPHGHRIWPIDFKLSPQDRELLRYEAGFVHLGVKMNDVIVYDNNLGISLVPMFKKQDGYFLLEFSFTSLLATEDYSVLLTNDDFEVLAKFL